VRCVPPENKPTPQEITTCRDFLVATMAEMTRLRAIVALGRIAHETFIVRKAQSGATIPSATAARMRWARYHFIR
jgi:uracil-DNA glycosylase family 4